MWHLLTYTPDHKEKVNMLLKLPYHSLSTTLRCILSVVACTGRGDWTGIALEHRTY